MSLYWAIARYNLHKYALRFVVQWRAVAGTASLVAASSYGVLPQAAFAREGSRAMAASGLTVRRLGSGNGMLLQAHLCISLHRVMACRGFTYYLWCVCRRWLRLAEACHALALPVASLCNLHAAAGTTLFAAPSCNGVWLQAGLTRSVSRVMNVADACYALAFARTPCHSARICSSLHRPMAYCR